MKILAVLLIFFIRITGLHAQPFGQAGAGYRISKSDYQNASAEKGFTYFKYDAHGLLVGSYWSLEDTSRYSDNYYEYDNAGNLIASFRDFSDDLQSHELFEYDSSGNKTAEYFFRSDSVFGGATYRYEHNVLIEAQFRDHKGWLNGTVQYVYGQDNRLEYAVLAAKGREICRIQYEHDSAGNLSREFWDFNGRWNQTFFYRYERVKRDTIYYSSPYLVGDADRRIIREEYSFNGEVGGPSYYLYTDNGLLAKKRFVRSDSMFTDTEYRHDAHGRLRSSVRTYSDGTEAVFSYIYDADNHLVQRRLYRADTLYGFESYLYDAEGRLAKAFLKNFDDWLTGGISYTLGPEGRPVGGVFNGTGGFDATLSFKYDGDGLLVELFWDFSFGKYQRYTFIYDTSQKGPAKTGL